MATYYLDDSKADDSGAATSEATAKKTFRAAWSLCTSSFDILRIKDNGNWYTIIPGSSLEILNTISNLFIMPYVGATSKYKLNLQKDPSNPTWLLALTSGNNFSISGGYIRRTWTGSTYTLPIFFTNNVGGYAYLLDCTEEDYKTDNATTSHQGSGVSPSGSSTAMFRTNVKQIHTGGRYRWHNGSSKEGSRLNCYGSVYPAQSEDLGSKMGDRFIILGNNTNQGVRSSYGTSLQFNSNNTYVLDTTNADQWVTTTPSGSTAMNPYVSAMNELWVKTGSNNAYAYRSSSAYTASGVLSMGNCVFAGFTLTQNITGLTESLGTSTTPSLTTSIFKSLDSDNADFLLVDETQTSVVAALSRTGYIPGTDIGYNIPRLPAGETDKDYILSSAPFGGNINPNTVMASNAHGTLSLSSVLTAAGGLYAAVTNAFVKIGTAFGISDTGAYDGSDRYTDIDLNQVPTSYNFRYNSLTNNRTGLRTAIYNLLSQALVKINTDRGDGALGVYVASERYSDPGVVNVLIDNDYQFNSETINRTSLLDPDYSDPANTLENDTTNGVQGEVPLSAVKETEGGDLPLSAIEPSEGGTSVGAESNDLLISSDLALGLHKKNLGVFIDGSHAGGSVVIPSDKVIYPYPYTDAEGSKIGQAGYIDISNSNISGEIIDSLYAVLATQFPAYSKMKYILDPLKNDFNNNSKQYGLLVQDSYDDVNKLLNGDVVDYRFKLVLTNDYISQPGDDLDARIAIQELIKTMESMRRVIKYTRAGTYDQSNLLWEFNFKVDSPQVIDNSKLVILNGYFRAKAKNTYIV